jgi:hypothetical protein
MLLFLIVRAGVPYPGFKSYPFIIFICHWCRRTSAIHHNSSLESLPFYTRERVAYFIFGRDAWPVLLEWYSITLGVFVRVTDIHPLIPASHWALVSLRFEYLVDVNTVFESFHPKSHLTSRVGSCFTYTIAM